MSAYPPLWRPSPIALAAIITGNDLLDLSGGAARDRTARLQTLLEEVFAEGGLQSLLVPRPDDPSSIVDALLDEKMRLQRFSTPREAYDQLRTCLNGAWLANVERLWKEFQPGCEILLATQLAVAGTGFQEPRVPGSIGQYKSVEQRVVHAGALALEPMQGPWRDCWLVASMAAIAWQDQGSFSTFLSSLPVQRTNPPSVVWSRRSDDVKTQMEYSFPRASNGARICTYSVSGNETWPALIEKAFAAEQPVHPQDPDQGPNPTISQYRGLMFRWPHEALGKLTKFQYARRPLNAIKYLRPVCPLNCTPVYPVVATTNETQPTGNDYCVMPDHAYAVLGRIPQGGDTYVVLREPYGVPQVGQRIDFGVAQFNGQPALPIGDDGVIAIPEAEFVLRFDTVSVPVQVQPEP